MSDISYITKAFKLNNALQFVESLSEPANTMYFMFAGRHLSWPNDARPPRADESTKGLVTDIFDNMIYGKNITPNDVMPITRKILWQSNTVYSAFTNDVRDLYNTDFYVVYQDGTNYKVFKCLDNNGGVPSVAPPVTTVASDIDYTTSDGYKWKWMYTISEADWNKFASDRFIPVIPNANVSANAVAGSIDVIRVVNGGQNYSSYNSGAIQVVAVGGDQTLIQIEASAASNADFYIGSTFQVMSGPASGQSRKIIDYLVNGATKTVRVISPFTVPPLAQDLYEISPTVEITGDGTGAAARAIVNTSSNSIFRVEVIERGEGYTWATATVTGNTGIAGNLLATSANVEIIIPPNGGHGYDAYSELGASGVVISVTFDASASNGKILEQNDIRTFGIIQDPLFANVSLNISSPTGVFIPGETVVQSNTGTSGVVTSANNSVVRVTGVRGYFASGPNITGASSNATAQVGSVNGPGAYFNQTVELIVDLVDLVPFDLDEKVTQSINASGYVQSIEQISGATYRVRLTNVRGIFNLTDDALDLNQILRGEQTGYDAIVTDVRYGDLIRSRGNVLYVDNFTPITKSNNQVETVKLNLEF